MTQLDDKGGAVSLMTGITSKEAIVAMAPINGWVIEGVDRGADQAETWRFSRPQVKIYATFIGGDLLVADRFVVDHLADTFWRQAGSTLVGGGEPEKVCILLDWPAAATAGPHGLSVNDTQDQPTAASSVGRPRV